MLKPNLQQTPNSKCLETITDQTNNNNKPYNPNQRTQHPPTSSEIPIEKATPLWPDFGIEKTDNDIRVVTGIRPETALVPEAKKLRKPSGVKLVTVVLGQGED